jgi:cell division septation protein DedD
MKNREFRELQVSSTQLAIIFFGILIIGVVIFLLGVSVGKKHAQASLKTATIAQKAVDQARDKLLIPETQPAVTPPSPAESPKEEPSTKAAPSKTPDTATQAGEAQSTPKEGTFQRTPAKPPARAEQQPLSQGPASPEPKEPAQPSAAKAAPAVKKSPPSASEEAKRTQPKADASPAAAAASKKGLYYVQVGALGTKAEASAVAQKYRGKGYSVVVVEPSPSDKKVVYRVRIGGFASKEEAEAVRAKLAVAAGKKVDYFLVRD